MQYFCCDCSKLKRNKNNEYRHYLYGEIKYNCPEKGYVKLTDSPCGSFDYTDKRENLATTFCCDCQKLNRDCFNSDFWGNNLTFKCEESGKYVSLASVTCGNEKLKGTSSTCYIPTIACEILGYDDNCELLNTLREFRENYLKKNLDKYLPILQQYDFIGPMISDSIRAMENSKMFAMMIMSYYLLPCAKEIKNNNYEKAIEIYKDMVLLLTSTFSISLTIGENIPYNFEDLGKGRVRINKKTQVTV